MKKKSGIYKYASLMVLSTGIVIVSIIYGFFVYNLKERGTFGDMFGGLTALYSGLAFAGIIYTILLQRKELILQRKELKQTREEFRKQNETLRKQRFENIFFNLLTQHHKTVAALEFSDVKAEVLKNNNKFDAFRFAHALLFEMMKRELKALNDAKGYSNADLNSLAVIELEEILNTVIKMWYNWNPHDLHLYFQSLRTILKFIDRSNLLDNETERQSYVSLVKDGMSFYEKAVVLYVGLLPDPWYKGLTFYFVKYRIFEGIDSRSLMSSRDKMIFDKWASINEPTD